MSTPIWFLSGVRSHVTLQEPGTGESFVTNVALVIVGVGQHVHVQSGNAHIHFVTNIAGFHILLTHLQVGLLVSRQVGTCGKMFSTFITLMFRDIWLGVHLGSPVIVQHGVDSEGFDGDY